MLARVVTVAVCGVEPYLVHVEADVSPGLPHTQIVGLPDTSVRESKERVHAAIRNSERQMPSARITVNLAPAELPKEGSGFDLPIAVALLAAGGLAEIRLFEGCIFVGELALDGTLRPVRGVLVAALFARRIGARGIVVPRENREEAESVEGLAVGSAGRLSELLDEIGAPEFFASGRAPVPAARPRDAIDLSEVKGQSQAKRALEVAAAGAHNILFIGPPGTGKTMLARRLPTVLPGLTHDESLDATMIHSVAGTLGPRGRPLACAPFRAPHHTVSDVGLVGGNNPPRPGEISLAHRGVLFLDELPEFRRSALEALRQPIEDGRVLVVRAGHTARFPARFQLVAAMNPCPCGASGHPDRPCQCTSTEIRRYRGRVSGPLLDRIDLHVWVGPVDVARMTGEAPEETSAVVRERVERARAAQTRRCIDGAVRWNGTLEGSALRRACVLPPGGRGLLGQALRRRGFSGRAIHRVMRVARTLADLEGNDDVGVTHLAEAVRYRILSDAVPDAAPVSARTAAR